MENGQHHDPGHWGVEDEKRTCLRDTDPRGCKGPVTSRSSFGGTGTLIWECGFHMDESYEREQKLRIDYPDSDIPPAWFDESYAGERWNDDY